MPRYSLVKQQGVVLVVALFIVALVAALSYVMMSRLERDTARSMMLLRNTQAEYYAQGSIIWAMEELRVNGEKHKKNPNQLFDHMPIKSAVNILNGYTISSIIYDMQSRFNINNVTNANGQIDFKRLLQTVDPHIEDQQAKDITLAVTDWITQPKDQNTLDKYYLTLSPGYRSPHQLMTSVSELRLVKGMTAILYDKLKPYVAALPATTPVNVQTAPLPILMTLAPTITAETAKSIEQLRLTSPIISPQLFSALDIIKNHPIPAEKVTTVSEYFLLETNVSIENQHLLLYTLIKRNKDNPTCVILWQSKNVMG